MFSDDFRCCYDAPSHMTEEMKEPSKEAPKAIVLSVYIGAITGFIFLVSVSFCIGDITSTADSTTGVPLIQIFYDSTDSVVGACFLASLITVIVLVCANALLAEGSRSLFAFARDHGLPFSTIFAKVEPKRQVPVYAILLACAVQMALNSIYFGTLTGFNTVVSIATEGFCRSSFAVLPPVVSNISPRPFLCHATTRAHNGLVYRTCKSPARTVYSGKLRHFLKHYRFSLFTVCVYHI